MFSITFYTWPSTLQEEASDSWSFAFLALGILLVLSLCIWISCRLQVKPFKWKVHLGNSAFGTELLILLAVTVGCISYIVYTAIPYNGALSQKVDSLFKTKKIEYEHNNFSWWRRRTDKDINKKLKSGWANTDILRCLLMKDRTDKLRAVANLILRTRMVAGKDEDLSDDWWSIKKRTMCRSQVTQTAD